MAGGLVKKIFSIILPILGIVIAAPGLALLIFTVNDYRPEEIITLNIEEGTSNPLPDQISITLWNIGYAGLGGEMDFFMDGGTKVRAEEAQSERYLEGITTFLKNNSADIFLLQEVDLNSTRSYGRNQVEEITSGFPAYDWSFAFNFNVPYVPVPLSSPLKRVRSGLLSISSGSISSAARYQLPGSYSWPVSAVHLDRCILVTRFDREDKKQWVVINLHTSAYDTSGQMRVQQLDFIRNFMLEEYKKGNFVVLGGDWNSLLPGIELDSFRGTEIAPEFYLPLPENFTPESWQWVFDPKIPTNRSLASAYEEGENFRTIIDGFLLSPNISLVETKTFDQGFRWSDHHPVQILIETIGE
jgi:endonuclease/exonuclease/phosphatase family metal-dependent hydrolase